ncbi:J domain-containing protein [Patescibacteria group bacterium]|nr:J domain-containing protein [Patescibacteria group bacterium]MBU1246971.1 J domain-containing protein [Patescibacteria group bacterium]MBU1519694.1 J domain-containing protein [Patescibacteria group bacterium]MBU1730286.1 J domain-containing protein [Patescibacteria group bacterium]MBU1956718.1 J domain-containing protein [Patescibacteria group bacterium]
MEKKKDYYEILGVECNASKDVIKKSFHKLAHKHHPDKKGGDEGKFKEINEAYSVLSDEKKRGEYDMYGHTFNNTGAGPSDGGSGGFSDFWQQGQGAQGFNVDLGDIFSEFFGGGGGSGRAVKRGRDISIDLEISFSDAVFGTSRNVLLNKVSVCPICEGSGAKKGTKRGTCSTCNGQGKLHETRQSFFGAVSTVRECTACHGLGEVPKEKCEKCGGMGVVKGQSDIAIKIPAGIKDGEMIRMSKAGEAIPHGLAGDLYAKIYVKAHSHFIREGDNLVMDLDIKLTDALLGSTYEISALDETLIELKVPAGVSIGEILRVKGKGVPIDGKRFGDLMVKLHIKMPSRLSSKTKKLIEQLREEGV